MRGDSTFTDVSGVTGIAALPLRVGRGAAFADYDNDGDVDIFVVNNHAKPALLRNDGGNRNNWLHVELIGTKRQPKRCRCEDSSENDTSDTGPRDLRG